MNEIRNASADNHSVAAFCYLMRLLKKKKKRRKKGETLYWYITKRENKTNWIIKIKPWTCDEKKEEIGVNMT